MRSILQTIRWRRRAWRVGDGVLNKAKCPYRDDPAFFLPRPEPFGDAVGINERLRYEYQDHFGSHRWSAHRRRLSNATCIWCWLHRFDQAYSKSEPGIILQASHRFKNKFFQSLWRSTRRRWICREHDAMRKNSKWRRLRNDPGLVWLETAGGFCEKYKGRIPVLVASCLWKTLNMPILCTMKSRTSVFWKRARTNEQSRRSRAGSGRSNCKGIFEGSKHLVDGVYVMPHLINLKWRSIYWKFCKIYSMNVITEKTPHQQLNPQPSSLE